MDASSPQTGSQVSSKELKAESVRVKPPSRFSRSSRVAVHDGELQLQLPVRAAEDDGVGRHFRGFGPAGGENGKGRQEKDSFHIGWLIAA